MSTKKRLPKVLYAKWDDNDPIWIIAGDDPKRLAEDNGRVKVGVYKLEGTAIVVNETTVELK